MRHDAKLHEETWLADDDGSVYVGTGADRMTFLAPFPGPPDDMPARARLAAAAPVLVRALLAIEWAHFAEFCNGPDATGCAGHCPACTGERPSHFDGCTLDAALREAGVR